MIPTRNASPVPHLPMAPYRLTLVYTPCKATSRLLHAAGACCITPFTNDTQHQKPSCSLSFFQPFFRPRFGGGPSVNPVWIWQCVGTLYPFSPNVPVVLVEL